jgi:hypothetical protein
MKKILMFVTAVSLTVSLSAQQPMDVQQGIPTPFSVTQSNTGLASTYTWSVDGTLTATWDVANSTTNNPTITFTSAPATTGNLSVYAVANTCQGNTLHRVVNVVSQLSVIANNFVVANVCPAIGTGTGDLSATMNFIDPTNGNAAVSITGYKYQLVNALGNVVFSDAVTDLANVTSATLNANSNFLNTQAGSYTLRITEITPTTGNIAAFGLGNYPNAPFTVNEAPVISW